MISQNLDRKKSRNDRNNFCNYKEVKLITLELNTVDRLENRQMGRNILVQKPLKNQVFSRTMDNSLSGLVGLLCSPSSKL